MHVCEGGDADLACGGFLEEIVLLVEPGEIYLRHFPFQLAFQLPLHALEPARPVIPVPLCGAGKN